MLKEIKKKNLADIAYDRILADVISKMSEGEKIPSENLLSKSLGVSRVVVREALEKLRAERILITFHGRGSFVANPMNFSDSKEQIRFDFEEFSEIMEFRSCIEYAAIKRAVLLGTNEELRELLDISCEMEMYIDNPSRFSEADYRFHIAIAKASKNKRFLSAMQREAVDIQGCLEAMNRLNDSRKWGAELHKKIAEKIIQRDSKAAIDILKLNGEYNLARMQQIYDDNKK